MDKKRLKKYVQLCGSISMIDFLSIYVGVQTQLDSLKRATHKNIRSLRFTGVVSVPFSIISIDDLENGDILLVWDCNRNIGAYKNPLRIKRSDNVHNVYKIRKK